MEKGQTIQWPKEKGQKDKQLSKTIWISIPRNKVSTYLIFSWTYCHQN